jgi:hypothetical protein
VSLQATFHLEPGYWFDKAEVIGSLAGLPLRATVERAERAEGGLGSTSTVAIRGSLDGLDIALFAAVSGSLDQAMIRGTVGGELVHLNARSSAGRRAVRVSGAFPGPLPLALLAVGAVLYFI